MKILKSEFGGIMIQVMLVGGVLAGLAPFIMKSGLLQGQMSVAEKQNLAIEETMNNMRSVLANSDQCKAIMDAGWTAISGLTSGSVINDQVNVSLSSIIAPSFSASNDSNVRFVFSKISKSGSNQTSKTIRRQIPVKRFTKQSDGLQYCISYEGDGVMQNAEYFCERFGGDWQASDSTCDFENLTTEFLEEFVYPYGCSVLGANLVGDATSGWSCDGVNISGDVTAPHFDMSKIDFSSVGIPAASAQRTDFQNSSCSDIQVATAVAQDSSINCADLTCPQPSTSTYSPVFESSVNQIQCQCNQDSTVEKPNLACGDVDPNSCSNYLVNDGCGTGNVCEIQKGLDCSGNEACINGSCVCQPNCACLATNPAGCSDGCGGTCAPAPSCSSSCGCAASTPVGQTCGDGCGGSCQGQSCSHKDTFSFIGTAKNVEEWASGTQICREKVYVNNAGTCVLSTESDTEAGLCKRFANNTCSGTTAAVIENVPNGTVCGDGKTCQAGECTDLIQLQNIGWNLTRDRGTYADCESDEVATGMCSSGEDRDCKDFDGVRKSHGVHCAKLTGQVQIDQSAEPQFNWAKEKNIITCRPGYVVQSSCGVGAPFTCPSGIKNHYPHAIKCVKLDFKGNNLKERSRYIYAKKMQRNTGFVKCASNEFLTGLCSIGKHKWNCFGNAYIMRCTKYE